MLDTSFDREGQPSSVKPCATMCKAAKGKDDATSAAVAAQIEAHTGRKEPTTGSLPTDNSPSLMSSDTPECQKRALTLGPTLRRFNRYREATPYAQAALDMNKLGDDPKPPKTGEPTQPKAKCLTRLPVTAEALSKELGLPPGTIQDKDLRNDKTGFRAAMYRDETSGKVILVGRDTQPKSLVDWQTNTRNGDGKDTDQYAAMRELSGSLADNGVGFDVAGYSKGGGLAQEAGLMNPDANVFVFNSAGEPEAATKRTGNSDFSSLESRTKAFSSENDFLTYMNDTKDPDQQIANVKFLRRELAGENRWLIDPMKIDHANPELDGKVDPAFKNDLNAYMKELDDKIMKMEADPSEKAFPPVRAGQKESIPNSMGTAGKLLGADKDGPSLGKLAQHKMENVTDGLNGNLKNDRKSLEEFIKHCG